MGVGVSHQILPSCELCELQYQPASNAMPIGTIVAWMWWEYPTIFWLESADAQSLSKLIISNSFKGIGQKEGKARD